MNELITLCGDNCRECPRYNAHTREELRSVAELWHRIGWRTTIVSCEEIACTGCSPHKECTYQLIRCTKAHGVQKCSDCAAFPCQRIRELLARSAAYQRRCREVCTPGEYAALERAFFQKERHLFPDGAAPFHDFPQNH